MKMCNGCGEVKSRSAFNKHAAKKDGLQTQCKTCQAEYRATNREALREARREYNHKRRVECRAILAAFKADGCAACGRHVGSPASLHAHHVVPSPDDRQPGKISSPNILRAELAKCVPLCSACHGCRNGVHQRINAGQDPRAALAELIAEQKPQRRAWLVKRIECLTRQLEELDATS